MKEPLKIIARFDINEDQRQPLSGRAYLSPFHFEKACNSDIPYVVRKLREVVKSPEFSTIRKIGYNHTVALIWAEKLANGHYDEMIDFFGWSFDRWDKDSDLSSWKTRNGLIVSVNLGISQITSENGIDILKAEKDYRHSTSSEEFRITGPELDKYGLKLMYDFCNPTGRIELKNMQKSY
ncbi:MAG: hypothetical protein PHH54_02120 [Candidatus Nanoarchaeia archaeon]|nr:hypothetical protein [Candidatus Nanoarchaeia archaeon]MDD5740758.1 hypothetical protein [Candidatus Nanoarchaeia archaeon]